jgi:hypothetical protein
MTTAHIRSTQLIPGAFERIIPPPAPGLPLVDSVPAPTTAAFPAVIPEKVMVIAAPRQPETWIARAGAVLGDLLFAVFIVLAVPLALVLALQPVAWLVRALVATVGGG